METKSVIDVYKEVLSGERKSLPNGTWNKENGIKILRYLIEEKLKWSHNDVAKKMSRQVLSAHHLTSLLLLGFNDSLFEAIEATYPNEYKFWEIKHTRIPVSFWTLGTGIEATKWLIEEKLKWTHRDVSTKLNKDIFRDANLSGMLLHCFGGSPYKAIEAAYPGEYKPWELRQLPTTFWTRKNAIEAIRWLVEEKVGLTYDDAYRFVDTATFERYNLGGLLKSRFKNNTRKAVEAGWR